MSLVGTSIGPYHIVSTLGAGGMGEVYRARDPKLDRDVAIKVLPDIFAVDPDRLMRFQREAKTLASLNHPNIAAIYGIEHRALIMELVEGEDLSRAIARGPVPADEALAIVRQIADALAAAHDSGIVHRDLKPANVKLRADGAVKVLDFGLAKAPDPTAAGDADVVQSPTFTSPALTQMGVVLGTAAYMAPEQARGKPVDRRADVWAFGAVFFELLSGNPPFKGQDVSDLLAAVLKSEPDWSALPPEVPASVRRLLRRCLEKDPRRRWQSMGDVRYEIDAIAGEINEPMPAAAAAPRLSLWRRVWPLLLGTLAGAGLVAAVTADRAPAKVPVTRLLMEFPETASRPALSPDGSRIAFVESQRLMARDLSVFDAVPVAGVNVQGRSTVLFSADGQSIVFAAGAMLRRVPIAGGIPTDVAALPSEPLGLSWAGDDILAGVGPDGVVRVSTGRGAVTTVLSLKPGEHAAMPQLLPGGDHVLFTLAAGGPKADWLRAQVVVQSVASGARDVVVPVGSDARVLPTGHIVYIVEGVWVGAAFDLKTRRVVGLPVALVEGVGRTNRGGLVDPAAVLAISTTGTLVYASGPASLATGRTLSETERGGSERPLDVPAKRYEAPRVSPDGRFLAVSSTEGDESIIWLCDLSGRLALRRLTFSGSNRLPVWSPDGSRIVFQSTRAGEPAGLFVRRPDGTGEAERLTTAASGTGHIPESWSRDGRYLAYSVISANGGELWMYSTRDKRTARFGDIHSTDPLNAAFSPDGRWVAYTERGSAHRARILVQPVPATGALYQVSAEGDTGHHPFWSPDGRELFYFGMGGGRMVSIPVTLGAEFTFGNMTPVKPAFGSHMSSDGPLNYDITPDGRAFVWTKPLEVARPESSSPNLLRVVVNWFDELRARIPLK